MGAPGDLDPATVVRIARRSAVPRLATGLLGELDARRARMLDALPLSGAVYGVTTGMGALSERALNHPAQAETGQGEAQRRLLLARAVGGPPWLEPDEVRAALAVRLRTLLHPETAVSGALCRELNRLLADGRLPAVPRTGLGSAGEIIALAHLAAPLVGAGMLLDGGPPPSAAITLGAKEGVALIEGVPVATALAILRSVDTQALLSLAVALVAAEFALTGSSRDCLHPALGRGDAQLTQLSARLRQLAGTVAHPRALQPPVSFRVSASVLTQLERCLAALDAAVTRALDAVTDSPVFLAAETRFVGSAGFAGYDLAAALQALTAAVVGAAELGAARLHRLMDPAVTGLPAQLSPTPGVHTGLTAVHKRAVGVVHALRRLAGPATIGPIETSTGQEDVQSFALEAAETLRCALDGWADVLAGQALAVHQMHRLGARPPSDADPATGALLDTLAARLPADVHDREWGRDLAVLRAWIGGAGANWTRSQKSSIASSRARHSRLP